METTNQHALTVRAALEAGAGAAELQLALIASNHGDKQLTEVIQQLTPAEVAVLSAEGDMSKPSIVHAFITAEQFTRSFRRIGSRWGAITTRLTYEELAPYQRDIADVLCPVILGSDSPERRAQLIEAMLEIPHIAEVLVFLTIGQLAAEEFLNHPLGYPVERGTWQELLQTTIEHQAKMAETFQHIRADITQGETVAEIVAQHDLRFAHEVLMEIREVAHAEEGGDAPSVVAKTEEFLEI